MPPATGASAHLRDLLRPVVEDAGYDLEDLSVTSAGRRSLVRVSVDADGGVGLDAIAEISGRISEALDADGDAGFAGPYVLEVSSPGVDRPLTEPRHWRRNAGRLVSVSTGDTQLTGRIMEVTEAGVALDVAGARRDLAFGDLGPGRVQVEFNRPDDAGSEEG
jgi:ribosome maturation factor RimP